MPTQRRILPAVLCAALLAGTPLARAQTAQAAPAQAAPAQAAPAQAVPVVPELQITEFGEYVIGRKTGVLDPALTPDTTIPVDQVEDVHFVNHDTRIEARLCHGFGIQFAATNLTPAEAAHITIRVTHPPMTYNGKTSSGVDSWQAVISGAIPGLAGYTFDHAWEAVPGAWSFAVLSGNTVLIEQHFDVIAAPGPTPALPCNPMVS